MISTVRMSEPPGEWESDVAFDAGAYRSPAPRQAYDAVVGSRTLPAVRAATLVVAITAVVVGSWGAFGSPPDAWRTVGDILLAPLLIGVVAMTYLDRRSRADRADQPA